MVIGRHRAATAVGVGHVLDRRAGRIGQLGQVARQIVLLRLGIHAECDGRTVAAMDVLVPGIGELIGGSQREERYDVLVRKIHEMGMHEDDYGWYLDSRKYGSVPHAGFGLGFERMMMLVTGIGNIRDVIPFPRTPNSINF